MTEYLERAKGGQNYFNEEEQRGSWVQLGFPYDFPGMRYGFFCALLETYDVEFLI